MTKDPIHRAPPARAETTREALRALLRQALQPLTLRELSQQAAVSEREVLDHLEHLERSLSRSGAELAIEPARCLACGFAFEQRTRFKKPGRCPACKATRITPPRFRIETA